jgi:hypothetical protein
MKKCFLFVAFLLIFSSNTQSTSLDELALRYGTDKSSKSHGYTKIYERYFAPLRDKQLKFLEIGFFRGASAHMWEDYFTQGEIHFIDVEPNTLEFLKNFTRTTLHIMNQEDPAALVNFIQKTGGEFDIIIDDGGHTMSQQIISFKQLFPAVRSGGVYVIEDLHTSYANYIPAYTHFGSKNQKTTVEFLQNLVHDINGVSARTGYADFEKCPQHIFDQLSVYEKQIESIHFYASLCFIFKR